jgi:hypothetical protein
VLARVLADFGIRSTSSKMVIFVLSDSLSFNGPKSETLKHHPRFRMSAGICKFTIIATPSLSTCHHSFSMSRCQLTGINRTRRRTIAAQLQFEIPLHAENIS